MNWDISLFTSKIKKIALPVMYLDCEKADNSDFEYSMADSMSCLEINIENFKLWAWNNKSVSSSLKENELVGKREIVHCIKGSILGPSMFSNEIHI